MKRLSAILVALWLLFAAPVQSQQAGIASDTTVFLLGSVDRAPTLIDLRATSAVLSRHYPAPLLWLGIGGVVELELVIRSDGTTDPKSIQVIRSEFAPLDAPTIEAAKQFVFRPAQYRGRDVAVLLQMPIAWTGTGFRQD